MKLLLIEGQPGSGKSTFASKICDDLAERKIKFVFNDENRQDTEIFTDFWEDNSMKSNIAIELFLSAWRKYISENLKEESVHIFDNSIMNHIQYLMATSTCKEEIIDFFRSVIEIFRGIDTQMIFLDGNSEIVIQRVDKARTYGWGERVAELLEAFPFQQTRDRKGKQGMVEFFHDSQELKRNVLKNWEYPLLKIDITEGNWHEYEREILKLAKGITL